MAHTCHAIACERNVPPSMFMCKSHWYMVKPGLRAEVWKHYRQGQEKDWEITKEYAEAAKAAIRCVAKVEAREVTGDEEELMLYDHFVESS